MSVLRHICDALHRRKRARVQRQAEASGVLLISSGGLGDVILFSVIMPVFARLKRGDETIDVIVQNGGQSLRFLYPGAINLIQVDYRRFIREPTYRYRVSDRIFAANYRLAISTDHLRLPSVDDALVAAAAALNPTP